MSLAVLLAALVGCSSESTGTDERNDEACFEGPVVWVDYEFDNGTRTFALFRDFDLELVVTDDDGAVSSYGFGYEEAGTLENGARVDEVRVERDERPFMLAGYAIGVGARGDAMPVRIEATLTNGVLTDSLKQEVVTNVSGSGAWDIEYDASAPCGVAGTNKLIVRD